MAFLFFEGDDDSCLFTVRGLPTTASWQGDHTHIVVAAMACVWHGPVFAELSLIYHYFNMRIREPYSSLFHTDRSIASAATLVASQCVEVAEAMGTERQHLIVAVNMRSHGDKVAAY
ncbi:FORKED 1 protein [Tanacetum coccineum]